ncbi:hypothetical protein Tco_1068961 [Tanacetum coccineum]|uniref:Uncharacterized protein n=1 Tax=Tanacetum coccineum TaxID=301880 RepID=A0ABQ5HI66_9ASTR
MEEAEPYKQENHLFIFYSILRISNGVPPRCACLGSLCLTRPLEFIGPWGTSGDLGLSIVLPYGKKLGYSEWSTPTVLKLAEDRVNLQSRVKEEDSITAVEKTRVFDLGVMDALWFSLCRSKSFQRLRSRSSLKFIELSFLWITRGFNIKVCYAYGTPVKLYARAQSV